MSHVYASVPEFGEYIRDGGGTVTYTANRVTRMLSVLDSASRTVDWYTDRSAFGSGFGPRLGTNRYDGNGSNCVDLDDDLLTVTSISLLDAPAGNSLGTPVADTDYYLRDRFGHYDTPPYRELLFHMYGSITYTGVGARVSTVLGKWGYQDVQTSVGTIGTATSSATSIALSGGAAYAGQTLLVDSEQIYVTASTGGTALTVTRGANGTTAAVHAASAAASVYVYPSEVTDATLQIALRRWKARDAGTDGSFGGGQLPAQVPAFSATELSILLRTVSHLKVLHVG